VEGSPTAISQKFCAVFLAGAGDVDVMEARDDLMRPGFVAPRYIGSRSSAGWTTFAASHLAFDR